MTMPTPPARLTSALLAMRSKTPRSHWTILPAAFAGSSVPGPHSLAFTSVAEASLTLRDVTNVVAVVMDAGVEAPTSRGPVPRTTAWKACRWVAAATVVSHGDGWSRVEAPGPLLPAEL